MTEVQVPFIYVTLIITDGKDILCDVCSLAPCNHKETDSRMMSHIAQNILELPISECLKYF